MEHVKIVSLYSGSSGNSTLIETKDGSLLIDAGKSARALTGALRQVGSDASSIKAVFITHEHTDHISALEVFLKKNPIPVHITAPSAMAVQSPEGSRLRSALRVHPPIFTERVGSLTVTSFPLSHDSGMCVGYKITTDGGYSFAIATDTGYVTETMVSEMSGCDAVVIESNHDVGMLRVGPYPAELKRRIMSNRGHLSNEDCASFAKRLAASGTRSFMLAHLSRENNRPEFALCSAKKELSDFSDVRICVAMPEAETVLVDF